MRGQTYLYEGQGGSVWGQTYLYEGQCGVRRTWMRVSVGSDVPV